MDEVVICYAAEDRDTVLQIEERLESEGRRVWWARDLRRSKAFRQEVSAKIARSGAVLVCWSPASVGNDELVAQARMAREFGRLVSLTIDKVSVPGEFAGHPHVDLRAALISRPAGMQDKVWRELMQVLKARVDEKGGRADTGVGLGSGDMSDYGEFVSSKDNKSRLPLFAAALGLIAGLTLGATGGAVVSRVLAPGGGPIPYPGGSPVPYAEQRLPSDVRDAVAKARAARDRAATQIKRTMERVADASDAAAKAASNARGYGKLPVRYGDGEGVFMGGLAPAGDAIGDLGRIITLPSGEQTMRDLAHYVGEFSQQVPSGVGIQVVGEDRYIGEFQAGAREGVGYLEAGDKEFLRYQGEFVRGWPDGYGVEIDPRGMVTYEGQMSRAQRNGFGVVWNADGCGFEAGVWKDDKKVSDLGSHICARPN